jgi:hypothetical protein
MKAPALLESENGLYSLEQKNKQAATAQTDAIMDILNSLRVDMNNFRPLHIAR